MKKIVTSLICPLIGVLFMTSCLKDDEETVKSSDVALLSFAIKDLKTTYTIKKENGEDSTYTTVMSGSAVKFTIDQTERIVYNSDSILFGTDITHVLVSVKADGGVCYLKTDGTIGSVEDSIDFTHPVTFRVTSYDEQFTRDYKVAINVHQVNPKETVWQQMIGANCPALETQKSFVKGEDLCVIGVDADGVYYCATTPLADGMVWTITECDGIEGAGFSVLSVDDVFFLKTDAGLYSSEDAITWSIVDGETEISALPGEGIDHAVAWFCQPLSTNEQITRTIFVATPETTDTCAQVWTKLSTEGEWVEVGSNGNNTYGCPNLENLTVIEYAGKMYAFGGKSVGERKVSIEAFSACYESRDNGVTWKVNENTFSLSKTFKGRTDISFSAATDGEFVWMVWGNGEVWRGRWNGIK